MKTHLCIFVVLLDGDLVQSPEHLGVAYLMAVLRKANYKCLLIDIKPEDELSALKEIKATDPMFVGISLTTVNFPRAAKLGKLIRQELGNTVHICAGGPIATFIGKNLLTQESWSFLDSIIRGEGENALLNLVNNLANSLDFHSIEGVTTRYSFSECKQVVAIPDINDLPWPERDQLENFRKTGKKLPYVRISTSRGCTSFCTFCNAPHARNNIARAKVWRGRNPLDIAEEIKYLVEKYQVDTFDFVDSTFEDPGREGKERIKELAELILQKKLKIFYNICSQAKNWHVEDEPLIELLFKSGLEKVLIGVESGSSRMLQIFKKQSTVNDNSRAIELFRKHGVYVAFGFIMFTPYSNWEDIELNANFLLQNFGHNFRRFITRLEIYPGAEILQQIENDGLLMNDYWTTLNPYGYLYENPEIGQVAMVINQLFGVDYLHRGNIGEEPAVFQFETFDITLHTYMSRLEREYSTDQNLMHIIKDAEMETTQIKKNLTEFNGNFFFDLVSKVRNGDDIPSSYSNYLEEKYTFAIQKLKGLQMRLGMKIRRQQSERGIKV